VSALPLTASGKLDRDRLPEPPRRHGGQSEPPRTPTEQVIAAIWAELLEADAIGRDDDFFTLGGHSLLATQLTSRIQARLQARLPLRIIFESPRLDDLVEAVDTMIWVAGGSLPGTETDDGFEEIEL